MANPDVELDHQETDCGGSAIYLYVIGASPQ
jgi:hypothetical protein